MTNGSVANSRLIHCITLLVIMMVSGNGFGQTYPNKAIRMLVGFGAGGPTDIGARLISNDISDRLGQPIVVENRPGAGGVIAMDALKDSPADGYTLSVFVLPSIVSGLVSGKTYDLSKDFTPLGTMWDSSFPILINPNVPFLAEVRNLTDLMAIIKEHPGKLFYSTSGYGSTGHLLGLRMAMKVGGEWTHVSYKGVAPASVDLVAGRIGILFSGFQNDKALIKEGKIRAVGVTGSRRPKNYPDTQTMREAGYPDLATTSWGGLAGPGSLPKSVSSRLAEELKTSMSKPVIIEKLDAASVGEPVWLSAEEMAARMVKDYQVFSKAISQSNLKPE